MNRRSQTTEHVLHSAAELFHSRGYGNVTVDAVAAHAGITKVTVYQHFRSKEALLLDCLNWRLSKRETALDARFQHRTLSIEMMMEIFDWSEDWLAASNFSGCAFTKTVSEMSDSLPEVRAIARKAKLMLRERLTHMAADTGLQEPEELGDEFATILEGAQILSLIEQNSRPFHSARNAARKLLALHHSKFSA